MRSRSPYGLVPLVMAASLLLAKGAGSLEVHEVLLVAAELGEDNWFFEVEVEGDANLVSATLTPPGRMPNPLSCDVFGGEVGCELLDPPDDSGVGFMSLDELLVTWPTGTYVLSVSDDVDTFTANLSCEPIEPDGLVGLVSPADGEADVSPTPAVSYVHTCTNGCTHFFLDIESFATPPDDVNLEFETTVPTTPNQVQFADFTTENDAAPDPLPDGGYFLFGGTAIAQESMPSFSEDPTKSFLFHMGAERERMTTFTVPEPEAYAAAAASLGTLGLLARRARRRGGRA